ncbi:MULTISPECIES: M15 family metallopeptidase [Rhodomicrobium]|uniref:M15 family metallopeptidase n=1 Tax=Rhodomicrobium TaxID=1068 RepID=UPI000B4B1363|nr:MULTISPECIES: M15 family metallopeptidase [Rhodomicrobium]
MNSVTPKASAPRKAPAAAVSRRARIHRVAAGLTHAMFVLLIALAFVKQDAPQPAPSGPAVTAALGPERVAPDPPERAPRPAAAPSVRKNYGRLPKEEVPEATETSEPQPAIPASPALQERRPELQEAKAKPAKQPVQEPAPAPPAEKPAPPAEAAKAARNARLLDRLVAAYPDALQGHDGASLIWRDGTRMVFDDGREKSAEERVTDADLEDMFVPPYPSGDTLEDPREDFDPGRARNEAFLRKMYGDCRKKEVQKKLVSVAWLPKNGGKSVQITSANGVAEKLKQVSDELDALPSEMIKFLKPVAGTFNCRDIARTSRSSAHAYGIAIDINARYGDYWQWGKPKRAGAYVYRNQIPYEIAAIFEKHGFVWGAKWYHFDTMHFEYRPELIGADDQIADPYGASVPMPEKQWRNLN